MPNPNYTTYSFKDTSGAFTHPLAGLFQFSGQIGMGQFTVAMATDQSAHELASDGTVMVSAISGDNGTIAIEVQQTSKLHAFLVTWYNTVKLLKDGGDVTNWATAAVTLRNVVDGSQHVCTGVSPGKMPDKVYTAQGQRLTWVLMCADIQNTIAT